MTCTEQIMGMPVTVALPDGFSQQIIASVFNYFREIDDQFSTYKPNSEISAVNAGLSHHEWSARMREVIDLCTETKKLTNGYFDIHNGDTLDPSGLVKGWAINNAYELLRSKGVENFYIEAGGDIQPHCSPGAAAWRFGIRNPFNKNEIVKVVKIKNQGIATSGTYLRGPHIYNPIRHAAVDEIISLTVVGPNIFEADRFATAAFAMGRQGIAFINTLKHFEGYMIDKNGLATFSHHFERYVL